MVETGVTLAGASDAPVTGYNPLEEIEVGVTRNSPYPGEEDTDMYRAADQALTAYQMLQAYTTNVAYENFMDDLVGTIEVGKKADLVALDQNILTIDPKAISDTTVLYTISNGRVVYEA
jgi:predicted amidohydrolase YtcJ